MRASTPCLEPLWRRATQSMLEQVLTISWGAETCPIVARRYWASIPPSHESLAERIEWHDSTTPVLVEGAHCVSRHRSPVAVALMSPESTPD